MSLMLGFFPQTICTGSGLTVIPLLLEFNSCFGAFISLKFRSAVSDPWAVAMQGSLKSEFFLLKQLLLDAVVPYAPYESVLASFPGPAQLSVASDEKLGEGLGTRLSRSRSILSRVVPKLQNSARRRSSATYAATDSPSFFDRELKRNRCMTSDGCGL